MGSSFENFTLALHKLCKFSKKIKSFKNSILVKKRHAGTPPQCTQGATISDSKLLEIQIPEYLIYFLLSTGLPEYSKLKKYIKKKCKKLFCSQNRDTNIVFPSRHLPHYFCMLFKGQDNASPSYKIKNFNLGSIL